MTNDNDADEVQATWHSQAPEKVAMTPEEIKQKVEQMEKKMRRATVDLYLSATVVAIGIVSLAVMYPHPLLRVGAALSLCGFAFLVYEIRLSRRAMPQAPAPAVASLDYQRALLQRRLEFHQKRLWWRVFALAPGGIVFFLGFAAALPRLAWLIYFELLTFLIGVSLIVPLNRRAAVRLQREIDELDQLR